MSGPRLGQDIGPLQRQTLPDLS